jgi:hypothetical protein
VSWEPPWDTNGDLAHVRVSASLLGTPIGEACLENLALRTHPEVYPREPDYQPRRYNTHETFGLGIVRDAILTAQRSETPDDATRPLSDVARDAVANVVDGRTDRAIPEALVRWARVATETYLETAEALRAEFDLHPGPEDGWRLLHQGHDYATTEMTAWGLAYLSSDKSVREFWLLRVKPLADASGVTSQTIAAAAFLTATGRRSLPGDKASLPHTLAADQDSEPSLVRVRVVSVGDGRDRVLWHGTPDAARAAWTPHRPLATALTGGGAVRPGRDCADCRARHVCPALPTAPGLLGLPSFGTHPRPLAPTALAVYQLCPARYLLTKVINLPREYRTSTTAMQRGLDIHTWLQHAHSREVACQDSDLPDADQGVGAIAEAAGLDNEAYRRALPFLRQHIQHCPLTRAVSGVWTERQVVIHDTDADVTVSTRPDLLLTTPIGPAWRETKTITRMPAATDSQLLAVYPQIAVAVCALADDALGEPFIRSGGPAYAELEILTPDRCRIAVYDCSDEITVLAARRAIAETADTWHRDQVFAARPGSHCAGCEVSRWCPSAFAASAAGDIVTINGIQINTASGEVLSAEEERRDATPVEAAAIQVVTDAPTLDDDPPPF